MIMLLIGLFVIATGLYYKKSFPQVYLFFIALGILLFVLDGHMIIQGELINSYYNGGTGITYRQYLFNETTNSTYSVDHVYYDYTDTRVGEYMAWKQANDNGMVMLYYLVGGLIITSVLVIIYMLAKKYYLIY